MGNAALLSVASGEAKGSGYDFYMRASEGKQFKGRRTKLVCERDHFIVCFFDDSDEISVVSAAELRSIGNACEACLA